MALLLLALLAAGPQPAPPPPAPSPPASAAPDPRVLLARLAAAGPSPAEVQAAAAREADRDLPDPSRREIASRLSALLPRLTAEVRHDEQAYRVAGLQASGEVDYTRSSPGTGYTLRATWELPDLVMPREPQITAAQALERARRRDELVRRALTLLFERRARLLVLAAEPPSTPLGRAAAELEIDRLGAELDALTGGLLTARGGP